MVVSELSSSLPPCQTHGVHIQPSLTVFTDIRLAPAYDTHNSLHMHQCHARNGGKWLRSATSISTQNWHHRTLTVKRPCREGKGGCDGGASSTIRAATKMWHFALQAHDVCNGGVAARVGAGEGNSLDDADRASQRGSSHHPGTYRTVGPDGWHGEQWPADCTPPGSFGLHKCYLYPTAATPAEGPQGQTRAATCHPSCRVPPCSIPEPLPPSLLEVLVQLAAGGATSAIHQ